MSTSEWILAATSILASLGAFAAIIRDRRKPELDAAAATKEIVTSQAVKAEIRRMSDESNVRRDLRILDLEKWGDDMRPWTAAIRERDDMMCSLIREDRKMLGLEMPDIPSLPPTPIFPAPRPLTLSS